MNGYDYVRTINEYYEPRTPRAALVAVEAGFVPVEAFIYRAAAITPLFEEPYDLDELERVLARPDLSFAEALALSEIFADITRKPDKELALFAAESLTLLEDRYLKRVQEKRRAVPEAAALAESARDAALSGLGVAGFGELGVAEPAPPSTGVLPIPEGLEEEDRPLFACSDEGSEEAGAAVYEWARALYEYALVAGRSKLIRNFYLREAYYALSRGPASCRSDEGFDLLIRCLLRLGLLDQAAEVIGSELEKRSDGHLIALAAEAAYLRRDPTALRSLLAGRDLEGLGLEPRLRAALEAWRT